MYNTLLPLKSLTQGRSYTFVSDLISQISSTNSYVSAQITKTTTSNISDSSTVSLNKVNLSSENAENAMLTHELASDYRFQKTQNPVFRYDFKVGHYMTDSVKILSRHVLTTFNDVTGGLRIAP